MIRKALQRDIPAVTKIYEHVLDRDEAGGATTGWIRGVYPTEQTAQDALVREELFVLERDGKILAAAKIDQEQVREYADCPWVYDAPGEKIMVLHTLVVDPEAAGKGCGSELIEFYEHYAGEHGCTVLRMDTNVINLPARSLYRKLGYREAGIVSCDFNGIPGVQLVCLEKKLQPGQGN